MATIRVEIEAVDAGTIERHFEVKENGYEWCVRLIRRAPSGAIIANIRDPWRRHWVVKPLPP